MPNTIRMKKGSLFADIHNSEETIARAMSEGYEMVDELPLDEKIENAIVDEIEHPTAVVEDSPKVTTTRRGRR